MRALVAGALALSMLAPVGVAWAVDEDPEACVDETLKADLDAKRRRRFVKSRLYQKTNRHEVSVRGGYYVSDVFDGAPVLGAAYSYHLTEHFAVEASGGFTRLRSRGGEELERNFSVFEGRSRDSLLFATNLVVSPLYGKFQMGGSVARFDLQLTVGAGVVDSAVSSGVAGNAGFALVFWTGPLVAIRLDVRNYVYQQQLLSKTLWAQDLAATLGVSMFFPWQE